MSGKKARMGSTSPPSTSPVEHAGAETDTKTKTKPNILFLVAALVVTRLFARLSLKKKTGFFDLPRELRDHILGHFIPSSREQPAIPIGFVTTLARVSRQVRQEALSVYYGSNTINFGYIDAGTHIQPTRVDKISFFETRNNRPAIILNKAMVTISIRIRRDTITPLLYLRLLVKVSEKEGLDLSLTSIPMSRHSTQEEGCVCRLREILEPWYEQGKSVQSILANACRVFPVSSARIKKTVCKKCGKRELSDVKAVTFFEMTG